MLTGSAKGKAVSRLLRINSFNRENKKATTSTNFTINFGNQLQKVTNISFVNCSFDNVFYNVDDALTRKNNTVTCAWIYNGGAAILFDVTITPGYYQFQQLVDALVAAFAAIDPLIDLLITFDPIANVATRSIGAANSSLVITRPTNSLSDPFMLLGADPDVDFENITATPVTYSIPPQLAGPRYVYLQSSRMSPGNSFDEKGTQSDIFLAVMNTAEFGARTVFECKVSELCDLNYGLPRNLSSVDIQVVDHEGNELDLHGTDIDIEMRVYMNSF